ncbi:hypothetical protein CRM22_000243 [Opisthorchis felineus]|uniref:WIF domain-containing protein n=1 Tax=Opisthorchis felineus TaxID=147828 RepID=A0A4S2MFV6_OPIFE|nr:hypothetical protein CRM22_000243 [Opisthorchis felineus]
MYLSLVLSFSPRYWCDSCHFRPSLLLLLLLIGGDDLFAINYHVFLRVSGQLSLWADRHLVMRIVESMPISGNSPVALKCPKTRPDIQDQIPEQLYLVFNGMLLTEVLEKISLSERRPIPPRIDVLRAKWLAGYERLTYNIELASLNHTLLHKPLLNIAPSGFVPESTSDVRITLPCTGKATGIAPFQVQLDIRREFEGLRKIPRISFIVYKYCLSAAKQNQFIIKCECRSKCARMRPRSRGENRKACIRHCRRQFNQASQRRKVTEPIQPRWWPTG